MIGTTVIAGAGSLIAILALPAVVPGLPCVCDHRGSADPSGDRHHQRARHLRAGLERFDRRWGTSIARGRVSRFISAVERQMLDLVRGNPRRLAMLMLATVAAYACMALEAWVILRASGAAPASAVGALAIETFSRVASFASAFIPANLGALEAASLAAVAAIGLAAAAPRSRWRAGCADFWAGIGLAIYPRGTQRLSVAHDPRCSRGRLVACCARRNTAGLALHPA